MRLDPLDAALLRLLREDARLSFRDLAEKTGSTTPTVSARVKALEEIGLIRGYHADVERRFLGGPLLVVTVASRPADAHRIAEALSGMPGMEEVLLLTGGRIQGRLRLRPPTITTATLHETLAGLEGVLSYDTAEVIGQPRAEPGLDLPEAMDVPCHQCQGPIHGEGVRAKFGERTNVFCCRQCLADFRERFERTAAKAKR
ncbi:MAG TPA: AsnC family transcriptional regulator [Candidatus Thermoplasmatota archaeon]|nr:AsnC family transcriptional regulator [Candidatus Thermoplasmatota archaeon]